MPTARQLTGDGDILLACNAVSFIFSYYKYKCRAITNMTSTCYKYEYLNSY